MGQKLLWAAFDGERRGHSRALRCGRDQFIKHMNDLPCNEVRAPKMRLSVSSNARSRHADADSLSMRLKGALPGSSPARKSVRNTITGFFWYAYPHSQHVPESGSGTIYVGDDDLSPIN